MPPQRPSYEDYVRVRQEQAAVPRGAGDSLDFLIRPGATAVPEETVAKGKVISLDKRLAAGGDKNRIYRIGIEVEGGWTTVPPGTAPIHDGSVFERGNRLPEGCPRLAALGEIASPPIEPISAQAWIKKYHPQVVDHTCGLHVHMGFKRADHYEKLMDSPDYQETLLDYLLRWAREEKLPDSHCIWGRLAGKNKYCRKLFWPDLQAVKQGKEHNVETEGKKKGHRYTVVNYCWANEDRQTLEIRVMPMMDTPDRSYRAVQRILDVTNAYLGATAKKEPKFRVDSIMEDNEPVIRDTRKYHV